MNRIKDTDGHGTAVASRVFSDELNGARFEHQLVIVAVPGTALKSNVVDAIKMVQFAAHEANRPYVINLSVVFKSGPRDGVTDDFEASLARFLDEDPNLKGIVFAAGNERYIDSTAPAERDRNGTENLNRRCHATSEGVGSFTLVLETDPGVSDPRDECFIEVWWPAASQLDVKLTTPKGELISYQYDFPSSAKPHHTTEGTVVFDPMGTSGFDALGKPRWNQLLVEIADPEPGKFGYALNGNGRWRMEVKTSEGQWHAYVVGRSPDYLSKRIADGYVPINQIAIGGNVEDVITVGCYPTVDSLYRWPTPDSASGRYLFSSYSNLPSGFSSRGPSWAGVPKPDVYAPGECVQVATSTGLPPEEYERIASRGLLLEGKLYEITEGTSMAAPFVAGLVAELVRLRPCLDHKTIRGLIIDSADIDTTASGEVYRMVNPKKAIKLAKKEDCEN